MDNKNLENKEKIHIKETINTLVENAKEALDFYMKLDQNQIDDIVKSMAFAGIENSYKLAKMAFEETKRGIFEDKFIKNMFSTKYIWNSIKDEKTIGIINENKTEGYLEIAEPIGVIAGVTPVTNPTSTTMFKSLICAKTRNPIIFGFHPSAQKSSLFAAKILLDAAVKSGAPKSCVQWIENPSIEATKELMMHPGISLVLATGGSAMVKSAYSTGKPALGVGPGNVPCYIEKSADLKRACTDIMISKTFDNGMICASEQSVIVDREISSDFEHIMKENNCYFLDKNQIQKISNFLVNREKMAINPDAVGQSAFWIAKKAGINVDEKTKILIAKLEGVGLDYPLSIEKLSPVLAYYEANNTKEGFCIAEKILNMGGLGHSAVIHSKNENIIKEFSRLMKAGRIILNSPASQGAIGGIYNKNTPSLTLGCGSYGKNSTLDNISCKNLINKKKVIKREYEANSISSPGNIYFEEGSVECLEKIPNMDRVLIVTDKKNIKLGFLDKIKHHLSKRKNFCAIEVCCYDAKDYKLEHLQDAVDLMNKFKIDTIIALGGKFIINAVKEMFHKFKNNLPIESNNIITLKRSKTQIRKIFIFTMQEESKTIYFLETENKNSYLFDDEILVPEIAIIDSQFATNFPENIDTATVMNLISCALEAYVSVFSNDYTDALALGVINLVFSYLELFYKYRKDTENGNDYMKKAREKIYNASCIVNMFFSSKFLGLNYAMAQKLQFKYNISSKITSSILLPYIIEYNASKPTKFQIFPNYEKFIADKKYAKISRFLGFSGKNEKESIRNLIEKIKDTIKDLNIPNSIKKCGVDEKLFFEDIQNLAEFTFSDHCINSNPRYPMIDEIKEIYEKAYF